MEIDPRDCQHGEADSMQETIDRLRDELESARKEIEALRSLLTWKYADKKDPVIEAAIEAALAKK